MTANQAKIYIGQSIKVYYDENNIDVEIESIYNGMFEVNNGNGIYLNLLPESILRSLDTITDEELIALARLNEPDGSFLAEEHFSIQRYSITHSLVRYKKVVLLDTRIRKYTPAQFEWLISHNFNIFNYE